MGHRQFSNSWQVPELKQNRYRSQGAAEQSYIHTGRVVAPENGSNVYPMENTLTNGVYCASYRNLEYRPVQHSSSNVRLEGSHFRAANSGTSYDPFSHTPDSENFYLIPESSSGPAHLSSYEGPNIYEVDGSLLDPTMGTGRGPSKRKSPGLSLACERGSTSRFYSAGSSSSSSEFQLEKSTSDYKNFSPCFIGFPPSRCSSLPFGSEDSLRNVRSRSRLDLEPLGRTYIPNQSCHHYRPMSHLTSHSGTLNIPNINTDHDRNCAPQPPAVHHRFLTSETIGRSHKMNRFLVGGHAVDIGHLHPDPILIRNAVSPPQYLNGFHAQTMSEGQGNCSQRAISSSRATPSFSQLGHEAAHSENGLQFLSENYSSRYLRPSSAGGWCNDHSDGRSRMAIERFEPLSNAGDIHDRTRPEGTLRFEPINIEWPSPLSISSPSTQLSAPMMVDHSSLYGSRNLFDRYREMRLDIDSMSYEELLALGERIGKVSTGLSESVMSKCLMVTSWSAKVTMEEARCAICLEEFKYEEEIGIVKNCSHEYHVGCIKKWLVMKNCCPVCKAPALSDS